MSKQNQKSAIRQHQELTGDSYTAARRAVLEGTGAKPQPFLRRCAKTTDPAVLEVIEDRRLAAEVIRLRHNEFLERITGDSFGYYRSPFSSFVNELVAVGGEEKPSGHGRWKMGPHGRGWVPAKNNPLEEEFEALNDVPNVSVPGLERVESMVFGSYFVRSTIFALDGTAWFRLGMDPEPHMDEISELDRIGANWTPVFRESAFMAAAEDWNERYAGTPDGPFSDEQLRRGEQVIEDALQARRARQEARMKSVANFGLHRTADLAENTSNA